MVDVDKFGKLSPLEAELLAKAATGEEIGQMVLPVAGDAAKRVRADLLRALLLGKIADVTLHAKGAVLCGAWIDGDLDFEGCKVLRPVRLFNCRFSGRVVFQDARVPALYLSGSHMAHLDLHRLRCGGDVHLRTGFRAGAGVDLVRAQIKGALACDGGQFKNADGTALNCNAMTVGASVFLRDSFKAVGEVLLRRAQITGQLDCTGGQFENASGKALNCDAMIVGASVFLRDGFTAVGHLNFVRARISGNLNFAKAEVNGSVNLESARVDEGLFWRGVQGRIPILNMTDASVGVLRDDHESWDKVKLYLLSGFRYDRIDSKMTVRQRIAWLVKKHEWPIAAVVKQAWDGTAGQPDFDPQPYTQLAKVLDAQGNRTGAARVLARREHKQRRASWARARAHLDGSVAAGMHSLVMDLRRVWDFVFRIVFGYGHQPAYALLTLGLIWAGATFLFSAVYAAGQMAPNSDVVLTSQEWLAAVRAGCDPVDWLAVGWNSFQPVIADGCKPALHLWNGTIAQADAAIDYETFHAGLYALDLFVPLDALGQETAWAPSKDRGWWGWFGYAMRMPIQMAGWIITAVGAAVVTGLVGRKD